MQAALRSTWAKLAQTLFLLLCLNVLVSLSALSVASAPVMAALPIDVSVVEFEWPNNDTVGLNCSTSTFTLFLSAETQFTQNEAEFECEKRGLSLSSVHSDAEWHRVTLLRGECMQLMAEWINGTFEHSALWLGGASNCEDKYDTAAIRDDDYEDWFWFDGSEFDFAADWAQCGQTPCAADDDDLGIFVDDRHEEHLRWECDKPDDSHGKHGFLCRTEPLPSELPSTTTTSTSTGPPRTSTTTTSTSITDSPSSESGTTTTSTSTEPPSSESGTTTTTTTSEPTTTTTVFTTAMYTTSPLPTTNAPTQPSSESTLSSSTNSPSYYSTTSSTTKTRTTMSTYATATTSTPSVSPSLFFPFSSTTDLPYFGPTFSSTRVTTTEEVPYVYAKHVPFYVYYNHTGVDFMDVRLDQYRLDLAESVFRTIVEGMVSDLDNGMQLEMRSNGLHFCVVFSLDLGCEQASAIDNYNLQQQMRHQSTYYAYGTYTVLETARKSTRFQDLIIHYVNNDTRFEHQFKGKIEDRMQEIYTHILGQSSAHFTVSQISMEKTGDGKNNKRLLYENDVLSQTAVKLMWLVLAVTLLGFGLAISGQIYAHRNGSENVRITAVAYFGLYTWDLFSDCMFSMRLLWRAAEGDSIVAVLCVPSLAFLAIPYCMNLFTLLEARREWFLDPICAERVRQWHRHWGCILLAFAALSGSSFGAVEMVNSNLYGLDFFSMGLPMRQLKKFENSRFWSSFLFENVPQLLLVILYVRLFSEAGFRDPIVAWAFFGSLVSAFVTLLNLYTDVQILALMKETERWGGGRFSAQALFVTLQSDEVQRRHSLLCTKPVSFQRALGETLEVHMRSIEVTTALWREEESVLCFGFIVYSARGNVVPKLVSAIGENAWQSALQRAWHLSEELAVVELESLDGYIPLRTGDMTLGADFHSGVEAAKKHISAMFHNSATSGDLTGDSLDLDEDTVNTMAEIEMGTLTTRPLAQSSSTLSTKDAANGFMGEMSSEDEDEDNDSESSSSTSELGFRLVPSQTFKVQMSRRNMSVTRNRFSFLHRMEEAGDGVSPVHRRSGHGSRQLSAISSMCSSQLSLSAFREDDISSSQSQTSASDDEDDIGFIQVVV